MEEVREWVRYNVLGMLDFWEQGSATACRSGVVGDDKFTSWKPSKGSLAIVSKS